MASNASNVSDMHHSMTVGDCRKREILSAARCHQAIFMDWQLRIETEAVRNKLENELCLLMEYVNQLLEEIKQIKQETFELTTLEMQHRAEHQASGLNKLRDLPVVAEKLEDLKNILSGTKNYFKGTTVSSSCDIDEWVEKLRLTCEMMSQNFENLIAQNKCDVSKSAEGIKRCAEQLKEEQALISEIRKAVDDSIILAVELKYLECTKSLDKLV